MQILVIGAGAMGSLFAARLALAGIDVTLFGRPARHLDAIAKSGLWLEELDGQRHRVALATTTVPPEIGTPDLVLVMVKAWATSAALAPLRTCLPPAAAILTLQNGLGNIEAISAALPGHHILAGITSQGAVRPEPGILRHTGAGPTIVGRPGGGIDDSGRAIAALFTRAGIQSTPAADIDRWIWRKLAVNAAINGPTALAGVPNGAIATNDRLRAGAAILAGEVATVAGALGYELGRIDALVTEIAEATANNRSSMLQDLDAGRRTEVGAIYDAMIASGAAVGIDTPANRVIAALIHAREHQAEETAA